MKTFLSYKKFFSAFVIAFAVLMSIPTLRTSILCPIHRFFETGPTASRMSAIREAIATRSWQKVSTHVSRGFASSDIAFSHLEKIAAEDPSSPFANALQATSSILSLPEPTGLTAKITFPIALFAETDLYNVVKKKHFYLSEKMFGRELQYDPQTKSFFIHLGTHGISPLGIGRKKVVTKTILYDREHPEVMARGLTKCNVKKEMAAMEELRGLPSLLEAQALMRHKDPETGRRMMTIVTKIYRPGSLDEVLKEDSWKLNLQERLQIGTDILEGLASIHSKKLVHRDLGARNYFVNIVQSSPESRTVRGVVADMGRTIPALFSSGKPVQGNSSYLAPESIYRENMMGNDYYQSDLFATGCVLWFLCFDAPPLWRKHHPYKKEGDDLQSKYDRFIELLAKAHTKVAHNRSNDPIQQRFEALVMRVTDPDPTKRGDAASAHKEMAALLKEAKDRPSA